MGNQYGDGFGDGWGKGLGGGLGLGWEQGLSDGNGGSKALDSKASWQYWMNIYRYAIPHASQEGTGSVDWHY